MLDHSPVWVSPGIKKGEKMCKSLYFCHKTTQCTVYNMQKRQHQPKSSFFFKLLLFFDILKYNGN